MRYQPTNSVWSCKKVGITGIDSFAYNHNREGFAKTENPAPRSSILLHFTWSQAPTWGCQNLICILQFKQIQIMKGLKIANRLIGELEYIRHQTASATMKLSSYAISSFVIDKQVSISSVEIEKFYDWQLSTESPRMVREKLELDCLQAPLKKCGPLIQMLSWEFPPGLQCHWKFPLKVYH